MAEESAPRTPRELFGRQREICTRLLGMSQRQVELVKQTKTDELLSLLAEKRMVLGELAKLQDKTLSQLKRVGDGRDRQCRGSDDRRRKGRSGFPASDAD